MVDTVDSAFAPFLVQPVASAPLPGYAAISGGGLSSPIAGGCASFSEAEPNGLIAWPKAMPI